MSIKNKTNKNKSLRVKIMIPQFILLFIEFSLLLGCIVGLGLLESVKNNEYRKIETIAKNRSNELQKYFNIISINSASVVEKINDKYNYYIQNYKIDSTEDTLKSSINEMYLKDIMPLLLNSSEHLSVSGAFVILNENIERYNYRPSVYIRDINMDVINKDYSDILYRVGPFSIAYDEDIKLDSLWTYNFDFNKIVESEDYDFYTMPIKAVSEDNTNPVNLYGYWSNTFKLSKLDREIITFTVPLINMLGKVYGLYGIEISEDIILNKMPTAEIPYENPIYMLYKADENNNILINNSLHTGAYFDVLNDKRYNSFLLASTNKYENLYKMKKDTKNELDTLCMISDLEIYSSESHFNNDKWRLACIVTKSEFFRISDRITNILLMAFLLSIILGIIGILCAGEMFIRPIKELVKKVNAINPKKPKRLEKIGVNEIDELSSAIEKLNYDVALAASKLSQTIDLIGLPIAGFEVDYSTNKVYLTDSMFNLLSIDRNKSDNNMVTLEFWNFIIKSLTKNKEEGFDDTYCFSSACSARWFRIKTITAPNQCLLGVVSEVTEEISRHKQLEYETKHDLITGFLKVNYFIKQIKELHDNNNHGALILVDYKISNNLDCMYKTDLSISYIKYVSEFLSQVEIESKLYGRMTDNCIGIYIYNIKNHNKTIEYLKLFIREIQNKINTLLPYSVEIIAGEVIYSSDTNSVDLMLKNAEFALNEARQSQNENVVVFNKKTYLENIAILDRQNALYDILSSPCLNYIYEPIFSIKEHRIIGYNTILRTQNSILKSFEEVVTEARLSNKLFILERLGLKSVFKHIRDKNKEFGDSKIFFNSITNEMISHVAISEIDFEYADLYKNIVVEIIDSEHCDDCILKAKNKELHKRGIEISLGKYGTSYSNEALLLYVSPSFIKISSLLVRGVDRDENRQCLIMNIVSYAKLKNIKVIASNVINKEEFEVLVKMGVEYFYGNYFCSGMYNIGEIINKMDEIYVIIDEVAHKYRLIKRNNTDFFASLIKNLPIDTQLTKREEEIVNLLCSNMTNVEIADSLDISSNTLKTHIRNIFNKFNVKNRRDLLTLCGSYNKELSTRENEILRLIEEGKANEEIADVLNISINTVRVHVWNICTKQNVKNRDELKILTMEENK